MYYNKAIFERCFPYKGRQWFRNLAEIPQYFRLMHYLIKYGYDKYATWEPSSWFVTTMREILTEYKDNMHGFPVTVVELPDPNEVSEDEYMEKVLANENAWNDALNEMLSLLDDMDENNPKYADDEYEDDLHRVYDEMVEAKNKFFELFSRYFYDLWD